MGPRDPIERELLLQRGDPIVLNEDPGWIKRAGARETPYHEPIDLLVYQAWLKSEAALTGLEEWMQRRKGLWQLRNSTVLTRRDQVRWALEYALLYGPGDPFRRIYISEIAVARAIEACRGGDQFSLAGADVTDNPDSLNGFHCWTLLLEWVSGQIPFPDSPPSQ